MTATYTFDVFSTLDGYGSYGPGGDWGGYWGKQGPEFLDRRLALYSEEQRMVFGASTYRHFAHFLGLGTEEPAVGDPADPNTRITSMPTTVVCPHPRQAAGPDLEVPADRHAAGLVATLLTRLAGHLLNPAQPSRCQTVGPRPSRPYSVPTRARGVQA